MREYRASRGERLDQIVFREYGTLEVLQRVLEANVHLLRKVELEADDVVYLPELPKEPKTQVQKGKALW